MAQQIESEKELLGVNGIPTQHTHQAVWVGKWHAVKDAKSLQDYEGVLKRVPHMEDMVKEVVALRVMEKEIQDVGATDVEHPEPPSVAKLESEGVDEAADVEHPSTPPVEQLELEEVDESRLEGLSEETKKVVSRIVKQAALEREQRLLAEKKAAFEQKKAALAEKASNTLTEISFQAITTEFILLALSSLSQAEGTASIDTATANKRFREEELMREQLQELFANDPSQRPMSLLDMYSHILENKRDFPDTLDRTSLRAREVGTRVALVSQVYQEVFRACSSFPDRKEAKNDRSYKTRIQETVAQLRSLFQKAIKESVTESITEPVFLPGPTNQEVDGVQPIFVSLLEAIADCCQLDCAEAVQNQQSALSSDPHTPPKTQTSQQKTVVGGAGRPERRCDVSVWKRGRYLVVMLDSHMQLTFEIKPGQRPDQSVVDLQGEAKDQCLSHTAKSLGHSLRFAGGAGVPSHATSVLGSLTYVEVIQLRLLDPGKPTGRVELRSSGPLPLVEQDVFDTWYQSDERRGQRHEGDLATMRGLLYPGTENGIDEQGIPLGIKAIYAVMMSSRQKLIGPEWGRYATDLGSLLGTGTFGMVFRRSHDSNQAVKVCKSDLRHYIAREAAVLYHLSTKEGRPQSVPQFVSSGMLEVTIGGVLVELPALAMKPVGQEVYSCFTPQNRSSILRQTLKDVSRALDFMHGNGIAHNDVCDSNILLVPEGHEQWRAILVDFSIASEMYQRHRGFHGTPPFVHRELHQNFDWFPVPEYDKTSLGFCMVVNLERGVIPWKRLTDKGPKEDGGRNDVTSESSGSEVVDTMPPRKAQETSSKAPKKGRGDVLSANGDGQVDSRTPFKDGPHSRVHQAGTGRTDREGSPGKGSADPSGTGKPPREDQGKWVKRQSRGERSRSPHEESVYEERIRLAKECVSAAEQDDPNPLDTDVAREINALLALDEQKFLYHCGCKKTQCSGRSCGCRKVSRPCTVLCSCYSQGTNSFHCGNQKGQQMPLELELDHHDFPDDGLGGVQEDKSVGPD